MEYSIAIGERKEIIEIPEERAVNVLRSNSVFVSVDEEEEIGRALNNQKGSPHLENIVHLEETIAIITSDITRPMPSKRVLPQILERLYRAGIRKENITIVFALGSHRHHTAEERKELVGEIVYEEIKCIDSDPDDYIHLGETLCGTPVNITRVVAEADRRICLGNIEYHYFAGYSGGAKAIMPGCSTREAIQVNHSLMTREESCAGNLDTNPTRLDIEEAAAICGIDYIFNVILDEDKKIVKCVSGDYINAHREGCRFLDSLCRVEISKKAEIVIVSQGGTPKDLNLYQTQKALDHAKHAVKEKGTIILVGSCKEGFGEKVFESWITEAEKFEDLIERIEKDFKLGGHKAAAIAMVLKNAEVVLVSDMYTDTVKSIFMKPYKSVQQALCYALEKHGDNAEIIIIPSGGSVLPFYTGM